MPPIHVVIASVPERLNNLRALLSDLRYQTVQPERVTCYLNGYAERPVLCHNLPSTTHFEVDWSPERRSAGYRWGYVEQFDPSDPTVLCTIDDDFRLAPTYLDATVRPLDTHAHTGMVAWTGHPKLNRYLFLEERQHPCALVIGGCGASAVRVRDIRGITAHPLASELLASGGDDELLVSLLMRERHLSIVRPGGQPPLWSVEQYQNAPTASHRVHATAWQTRRRQLADALGER